MKKRVLSQLFAMSGFLTFIAWLSISGAASVAKAALPDPADVDSITQIGQDMGDAMVAGDVNELSQIFAEDWASVGSSGKVITKETLLDDFKSFHDWWD